MPWEVRDMGSLDMFDGGEFLGISAFAVSSTFSRNRMNTIIELKLMLNP